MSLDSDGDKEYPCLIRATDGKRTEFSTHVCIHWKEWLDMTHNSAQVHPEDLEKFHSVYGALLKSSMSTLRKRDKKREKQRAEKSAAKKRKLTEPIIVQGSKRGNGRRKRQRLVKAALRQEETRKKTIEQEPTKAKPDKL